MIIQHTLYLIEQAIDSSVCLTQFAAFCNLVTYCVVLGLALFEVNISPESIFFMARIKSC